MSNADFLVTSGALSVASLRIGLRRLLPVTPAFARKVSDQEAQAFLASLGPASTMYVSPDATVPTAC